MKQSLLIIATLFSGALNNGAEGKDIPSGDIAKCTGQRSADVRLACFDALFAVAEVPRLEDDTGWRISESIDPISDAPIVMGSMASLDGKMIIHFRCKDGAFSPLINFTSFWPGRDGLRASMRVDGENPVVSYWNVSPDRHVAFAPSSIDVTKRALRATTFAIRFESEGVEQTGVFEFGDTSTLVSKLRAACPKEIW